MADAFMILKTREVVRLPQRATFNLLPKNNAFGIAPEDIFEILRDKKFSYPLIIRAPVYHRQMATLFAVKLFKALQDAQYHEGLEYTIDWWKRPNSQSGPGHLTVAFRFCDFREFAADE